MATTDVSGAIPDVSPDLPTPGWRAMLAILAQLPQPGLSRAFGYLADIRVPAPMRRPIFTSFARAVGIDLDEAEHPPSAYATLDEFFVRRLRAGLRSFPGDPAVLASPVDGVIGKFGTVRRGEALQAKGRSYSIARLLDDEDDAARYEGGIFLTLYLSPRHYHRMHSPCDGVIPLARHVPGALLPVNQPAVSHVQDLFPRNERMICTIDGPLGRVAIVAIGAYNVGRISSAFDPDWGDEYGRVTNRGTTRPETRRYDPAIAVRQGDEIMAFHLGSTLVLLAERGAAELIASLEHGREVRLGEPLARASTSTA
jgi:phosphatidylserine decarboxylase